MYTRHTRDVILTPDQRLRVFVSSTLDELGPERAAVRGAIERLRLVPVMFELGARPHPPRELYRAYLEQSQVFVGIYWQRYGWVAPDETISGLEDEYRLAGDRPRLIYLKGPAPDLDPRLGTLLQDIRNSGVSYRRFTSADELADLVEQDLALLLTEAFEAASAAPPAPTAPPAPLASIVGRDDEVAAVAARLDDGARVVTLTGIGGVGKTRLALEVARAVGDRYPDGVHMVPLAAVTDPALVVPTIAARLGARVEGMIDAAAAVVHLLAGQRALLLLDNLEQVADAAPQLAAVLERCPTVQVLATSRRPLRIAGEHEWPVATLRLPPSGATRDEVVAAPAVALFVERARAVQPGFHLDDATAGAVARLCERLDGHPLAIELAAARARLLPPSALLERLGDRLDLLAGGGDRPARHRTLRATVDWSHDLLDDREKALFARLGVFAGGCSLAAAEAVCDVEGHGHVLVGLAALLDHGLLVIHDDSHDDEPRVRMLDTVRTYATEQLRDRGEFDLLRRRHLHWYRQLTDRAQPFLCGPHQLQWAARIDPERADLRAAVRTAFDVGDVEAVVELAWDVYVYYAIRGAHQEPESWMREAAASRERLDRRLTAVLDTALVISGLWRGEHDGARERLVPALATFRELGLDFDAAVASMHVGLLDLHAGDLEAAVAAESAASSGFAAIGHDWGVASSEQVLGMIAQVSGDLAAARAHHEHALHCARRIGNEVLTAQALSRLAALDLAEGHDPPAATLDEAVGLLLRARDATGACGCLEVLGAALLAVGAAPAAVAAFAAADATRRRLGTPLFEVLRGELDHLVGRAAEATGGTFDRLWADADPDAFATLAVARDTLLARRHDLPVRVPEPAG